MSKKHLILKTRAEIERNFRHVVQALQLSNKSYDAGFKGEAARLAALVFMLVHDGGRKSISLLSQLGIKRIAFLNTCRSINPEQLPEAPLTIMRLGGDAGFEYIPRLTDGPPIPLREPTLRFGKWWEMPVLRDGKPRTFSRKNIVWHLRHGEGGGHVDPTIDERFVDLERNNSMGWWVHREGKTFAPEFSPLFASMRQISFEVETTLHDHCKELMQSSAI